MRARNAIALLLTLFFIIAITVLVGIGLRYVHTMAEDVQKEKFLLQSRIILDDVLRLLKTSSEINAIVDANSSEAFALFLAQSAYLPLSTQEMEVNIEISSARAKLNVNSFRDSNNTLSIERVDRFKEYLNFHNVDYSYADILLDGMFGVKEDLSYNSDIFYAHPHLFRDYIASPEHLRYFNNYFKNRYRYNTLENIDFQELFYYSKDQQSAIDLNFATVETWMFLLGIDRVQAKLYYDKAGFCSDYECLGLGALEREKIEKFRVSFYEPIVAVNVTMYQNNLKAVISFEYDLKSKKGSYFVYKI